MIVWYFKDFSSLFLILCVSMSLAFAQENQQETQQGSQQEGQQEKQDTLPDTSQADIQLEDIYVTANKYPQKLLAVGKQVQLISGDQLSYQGGNDFSELVNQTSIHVLGTRSNPTAVKRIYIRGAPPRQTLLMMDGIPLFDPSGITNVIDPRLLSLNGLEAVEVFQGGYSTLYGSNAVAGVINLRSSSPANRLYSIQGDLSYGSLDTYHSNLNFSGRVGLGPEKKMRPYIGYTASASWYGSTGISEADRRPGTVAANTPLEIDGVGRQNYRLALEGKFFSNHLHVRSSFYYSYMNYDFDADAFTDASDTYARFDYSVFNNILNYQPNPKWKVTFKHSFQHMSRFFDFKSGSMFSPTAHLGQFNFFDLYTRYDFSDRFGFLVGLDYRFYRTGIREYAASVRPPARTNTSNLKTFSSFQSQVSRPPADYGGFSTQSEFYTVLYMKFFGTRAPLHLELGTRVLMHPSYEDRGTISEGGGESNPNLRLVSLDFNPFFVFKNKYKLYFSYATAYTLPTPFQSANVITPSASSLGINVGRGGLRPEYTHTFSLGFDKVPPSPEKQKKFYMSWRFALFINNTNHAIVYVPLRREDGRMGYANDDYLYQIGIEFEPSFYFGPYWQITMGYTGLSGGYAVEQLHRIPRSRFRTALIWKPKRPSLYLRFQSQAVGRRSDMGYYPNPSRRVGYVPGVLPSYVLFDFYAAYNMKKLYNLRFFVEAQNLFNNQGYREFNGYNTLGIQIRGGLRFSL